MIYIGDDWMLIGKDAIIINSEPVPGSTQMLVEIDGNRLTVAKHELRAK